MAWHLDGKPRLVKATRALAQEFQDLEAAPRSNKIRQKDVDFYRKQMMEGTMRPIVWGRMLCLETDKFYRGNGNRTSRAILSLEKIPDGLYVAVEDYIGDTLEDVAQWFGTYDTRRAARNCGDIYLAYAGANPKLEDVPSKVIKLAVSGMAFNEFGFRGQSNKAAEMKGELLLKYTDFVLWTREILSGENCFKIGTDGRQMNAHIYRSPVVAVMQRSWNSQRDKATEFWTLVRDESSPQTDHVTRQLARFLRSVGIDSKGMNNVSALHMFILCVQAWDLFADGKVSKRLRYDQDYPISKVAE